MPPNENTYLQQLLRLQQDGPGAISSPSDWSAAPLLEVPTPIDEDVNSLVSNFLESHDPGRGRWHFLVGAPGNGKSAATGRLVRVLHGAGFTVCTEDGRSYLELPPSDIPYLLKVSRPGQQHAIAWIAQDASAVRDAYSSHVDPAADLLALLEQAHAKGVSLVVCSNRGVLENAHRQALASPDRRSADWVRAISVAVGGLQPERMQLNGASRAPFTSVTLTQTALDQQGVVVATGVLDALIERAADPGNWSACLDCSSASTCPFWLNSNDLREPAVRRPLVTVLRHAEILSGQPLVMREAVALVSLLMSGCPRDYTGASKTPCSWVHQNAASGDIFSLLARRFYMLLFSSYSPYGLETDPRLRSKELAVMRDIQQSVSDDVPVSQAMRTLTVEEEWASTDVGLARLLGQAGVVAQLDPFNQPMTSEFCDAWDPVTPRQTSRFDSPLEEAARKTWQKIEAAISADTVNSTERARALRRWASAYTYRLGALSGEPGDLPRTALAAELEALSRVLGANGTSEIELQQLEEQLGGVLGHGDSGGVKLSDFVLLGGPWTELNLAPTLAISGSNQRRSLHVSFGQSEPVPVDAEVFIWLWRKLEMNMSALSFPRHYLDAATDSLAQAACVSQYHLATHVRLTVDMPSGEKMDVVRRPDSRVVIQASDARE